jgi:ABC-type multidrug transport system ATPase subunit
MPCGGASSQNSGAFAAYQPFTCRLRRSFQPLLNLLWPMSSIISIRNLSKTYATGFEALKHVDLEIRQGEIFALLGPNGAGKTTLISIVCGIVNPSEGSVTVDGHDIITDYRAARSLIGLVPQELTTDAFETVWNAVSFTACSARRLIPPISRRCSRACRCGRRRTPRS